jgi:TorA maturation chaperone TorD
MDHDAINKARVIYYGLFSSFFSFNIKKDDYEMLVSAVEILLQSPLDEQSENALTKIQRRLHKAGFSGLKEESDRVFYSPTSTFVPMTASYYIEQRDDGSKRLEMIQYISESKFRRNSEEYKEHEDHIEFILRFLQKLIIEELNGDISSHQLAKKIFANVLNEIIDDFSDNLFDHEKSSLFKQVALVLRSFIDFERFYFNINKPGNIDKKAHARTKIKKSKKQSQGCVKLGDSSCVS